MFYHHNMGKNEKVIRLVGGAAVFVIGWIVLNGSGVLASMVTATTLVGFVLALIGVILFVTGLFSWCPLNAMFHYNSCDACKEGATHRHLPV